MRRNLLVVSVLALMLGFSLSVFAKGFQKMEEFSKLPQEKQQLVIDTMKTMKEGKSEFREEMKAAKNEMHEALTAPEFDEAKFQESVQKMEQLRDQRRQMKIQAISEIAPQFTQEERQILARIFHNGKHGHGHHKRGCNK